MALLTTQKPVGTGVAITYSAATTGPGDTFRNTGKEFMHVKNGSGSPVTVTFDSPATCSFGIAANAAHDRVVSVPATGDRMIGPFATNQFNNNSSLVVVTYSDVTTVTVAVLTT